MRQILPENNKFFHTVDSPMRFRADIGKKLASGEDRKAWEQTMWGNGSSSLTGDFKEQIRVTARCIEESSSCLVVGGFVSPSSIYHCHTGESGGHPGNRILLLFPVKLIAPCSSLALR